MYDELADHYDLIYQDWKATMRWQGEVIAALFPRMLELFRRAALTAGVVDAAGYLQPVIRGRIG